MIEDYRIYRFSRKEAIVCFFEGMLLNAFLAILFFNSFYAMIPGIAAVVFYIKEKRRKFMRRRMRNLKLEFKEFLNALIAELQTGRSIENAFVEALKDTQGYLERETIFIKEMKRICGGVTVGEPLEKLMLDFSYRSHLEEMEYFAEVFSIGKRSGGNIIGIMKNTIRMIQERMDAEEELYTVLSEKQMEFYLMCIIPFAIIVYLRITAGSLIGSLYGNWIGIIVMTVCLVIYGGCFFYGKRLLEFEN